jgi:hypothetical protein
MTFMQLHRVNHHSVTMQPYRNRKRKRKYVLVFSDYSVPVVISPGVFIPNTQASIKVQSVTRIPPQTGWIMMNIRLIRIVK